MATSSENQSNNPEQSQIEAVRGSNERDTIVVVEDGFTEYESASKLSRKTSVVWNDFGEITSNDKSKITLKGKNKDGVTMVECKHCKNPFTSGPTYGTNHLKRHLKVCPAKGSNDIKQIFLEKDPRYKKAYLQYAFDNLYGDEESVTLYKLFDEYKKPNECDSGNSTKEGGTNIASSNDDFEFSKYVAEKNGANKESELDGYLAEPLLDSSEPFDVLEFWNKSSIRYPNLSRMVADLLCILVSMVTSEPTFSIGGKIITTTRSSLDSKTVQAIVCLNDWLKDEVEEMIMEESEPNDSSSDDDGATDEEHDKDNFF